LKSVALTVLELFNAQKFRGHVTMGTRPFTNGDLGFSEMGGRHQKIKLLLNFWDKTRVLCYGAKCLLAEFPSSSGRLVD